MSCSDYNYDEGGQFFPFFVLTIAGIVTLPTTYSLLRSSKELESTAPRINTDFKPQHADLIEGQKKKQKRRERKLKRMLFSGTGWLVMSWMVYLIIVTARTAPNLWDPYDVLGVSRSASEKQIKSHYRKMSLTMHPDKVQIDESKNVTMESANEMWVEVTKAFKALTDEEVRNNYLQYGHPDGKQSFSMGIALPTFFIKEGSGKYTVAFYLAILGIFLRWLVPRWWYGTQKVTKEGILVSSAGSLFRKYREDVKEGDLIAALSTGDEYKDILSGSKAEAGLATVEKKILVNGERAVTVAGLSAKDKKTLEHVEDPVQRKSLALLWAYLGRVELDDPTLNDEMFEVAPTAYQLNEAFTIFALSFGNTNPLLASYHVSQSLIQRLTPGMPPLLQLPNFTTKIIKAIQGESTRTNMSVQAFMSLPADVRKQKSVSSGLLSAAQLSEAESLAKQLPCLQVEKAFFKVRGERYVTPGSYVQLIVKGRIVPPGFVTVPPVKEKDLEDSDRAAEKSEEAERVAPPLAHGPYFARDHSPRWHIFLCDKKQGKIAVPPFTFSTFDQPMFGEDGKPTFAMQTLRMQFGAPAGPGHYTFTMHVICDSYVGFDTKMDVTMVVEDASKAEAIAEEADISEPEEDSIAGTMKALRNGSIRAPGAHSDSGSDTEGDNDEDDSSATDTDTDEDD